MSGNGDVTPVDETAPTIHASCKIMCFCQGAVEICLRFICIVLCVVLLSVASLSRARVSKVDDVDPFDNERDKYASVSGWMIFVSVMGIVTETFVVIARFLNISVINQNFSLIGLMDVITSFVFTACSFAGWVPSAVYASDVKDIREDCEAQAQKTPAVDNDLCNEQKDVESALAATAVFGAFVMLAYLTLAVYMSMFIVCRWNRYVVTGLNDNALYEQENKYLL